MIKERSLDALSGTGFVVVSVSDKLARLMMQLLAHRLFPVSQDSLVVASFGGLGWAGLYVTLLLSL